MKKLSFYFYGYLIAVMISIASCRQNSLSTDTIKADTLTAIVQTESGKVAGYIDNGIYNFKGIPYAQAERFMPPVKPAPWTGVRSSRAYGPNCPIIMSSMALNDAGEFPMQHDYGFMNENCLNLNIWTQGINDGKKRPVMLWIHGGGFNSGSSRELPGYDGLNLSKIGDVVVVSINHRLNILGFLDLSGASSKYKYSANVGMLDIIASLEWVKTNISNFGGDPGNVTVFGQSGGGAKVALLLQMPGANGLFHKAIMESSGTFTLADTSNTRLIGLATLEELGFSPNQVDSLLKVPYDLLIAAGNRAIRRISNSLSPNTGTKRLSTWEPSIDGEVIPYQMGTRESNTISKNIPLIVGTTRNEVAVMMNPAKPGATEPEVKEILQKRYGDRTEAYIAAVKKAYPDITKPYDLLNVDFIFRPGAIEFANKRSTVEGIAPVYMYLFAWKSPILDGSLESAHCMEIPFVFNNIARCREQTGDSKETYTLAEKISKTWVNFATTGNPNGGGIATWEPYTEGNGTVMILDNVSVIKNNFDRELLEFAYLQNTR